MWHLNRYFTPKNNPEIMSLAITIFVCNHFLHLIWWCYIKLNSTTPFNRLMFSFFASRRSKMNIHRLMLMNYTVYDAGILLAFVFFLFAFLLWINSLQLNRLKSPLEFKVTQRRCESGMRAHQMFIRLNRHQSTVFTSLMLIAFSPNFLRMPWTEMLYLFFRKLWNRIDCLHL